MSTVTPHLLIDQHLSTILAQLPGVYDGEVESIHQARITTRRLREVLAFIDGPQVVHARETVRAAGRQLGRVRELDVMSAMLTEMGDRLGAAAAIAALARHEVRERQRTARRAMVKGLETLDLESLGGMLKAPGWRETNGRLLRQPAWVDTIWSRIAARSADAAADVRRAPGVYLAERSHRARIAVKKLRYAVEVAFDTGIWRPERLLKDLRQIQSTLGDIRDAQVLADALGDLLGPRAAANEAAAMKAVLDDDVARGQKDYTRRRDRIFAIAEVCSRAAGDAQAARSPGRTLVAASALAAPLLLFARRRVTER